MDSLPAGVYVLEATNGTYRAYTVLSFQRLRLVTKTSRGRILAYYRRPRDGHTNQRHSYDHLEIEKAGGTIQN